MPEYRMLHKITGTHDGVDWPDAGERVSLAKSEGDDLVIAGLAVEAAAMPSAEKAVISTTPKRRG